MMLGSRAFSTVLRRLESGLNSQRLVSTYNVNLRSRPTAVNSPLLGRRAGLAQIVSARFISQSGSSGLSDVPASEMPPGFLPPPPDVPTLPTEELLTTLGEPALASLGLCNYTPAGLVQYIVENIHVLGDIPWFGSIMILTLVLRLGTLPLTVIQRKSSIMMSNHMPTMQKLQRRVTEAQQAGDRGELEKSVNEYTDYMKRNDISVGKMLLRPMAMAPVFISVFSGIRAMTSLPVQSMTTGGALWFTDLTVADPYFILPAICAVSIWAVTKTGAEGASLDTMPAQMRTIFKVMPVILFGFVAYNPAALALYWSVSNIMSLLFVLLFEYPAVKKMFNMPDKIIHPPDAVQSIVSPFEMISKIRNKQMNQSKPGNPDLTFRQKMEQYQKSIELANEMELRNRAAQKIGQINPDKAWKEPIRINTSTILEKSKQTTNKKLGGDNTEFSDDDKLVNDQQAGSKVKPSRSSNHKSDGDS